MRRKPLIILRNLDLIIAGVALIVLIFVTFFGVFMRYIFGNPFIWQEEVQQMCFVWITFMAAGAAFRTGNHVAIDIVIDMLPKRIAKVFEAIIYAIVLVVVLYLFWQSLIFVKMMYDNNRITNLLHIPYAFIYSVVPVSCILMLVNCGIQTWKNIFPPTANTEPEVES